MWKPTYAALLAGIVMAFADSSGYAVDPQAIDRAIVNGVKALRNLQNEDGAWPPHYQTNEASQVGATALAGLALLECGSKADEGTVLRAAEAVRRACPKLTLNYSICLAILFFDRLGDANDVPLIESLTVRLLAGQGKSGGWSYYCPPVSEAEVRRLRTKLAARRELIGQREMPKPGGVKRTAKDLSPEIQQQLALLKRTNGMAVELGMGSDNSNTQFATLALWVARRYGLPVEDALKRVGTRFRNSQKGDGGWGYFDPNMRAPGPMSGSTASMTCAGLLGLAVADGERTERIRERNPSGKPPRDLGKDPQVRKGLLALSSAIDGRQPADRAVSGRTYYFLWSLERVAVALDLKTIGKKDWYAWGAEILLANQQDNGSWQGSYGDCGADTCFALLFLKRANFVPDLTAQLTGRIEDPGTRVLKRSETGEGIASEKSGKLPSGLEDKNATVNTDGRYPTEIAKERQSQPAAKPQPARSRSEPAVSAVGSSASHPAADAGGSPTAAHMAEDLAKSTGTRHGLLLNVYRDGKGVDFTVAMALAIPRMRGDLQRKTREALAERLTRMKDTTLKAYLADENLEIRIAAARASALKGSKSLVPQLIPLLRDPRNGMDEAAHQALKELSGQDFGPKANANREERMQATRQWTDWWNKQPRKDEP